MPADGLGIDHYPIVASIRAAAGERARWLFHPCLNPLTRDATEKRLQRDLQMAAWVAGHATLDPQTVTVPDDVWIWAPDGGTKVPAGSHDLSALGALTLRTAPWAIALDIWGRSLGLPVDDGWADVEASDEDATVEREQLVRLFLRSVTALERYLKDCHDWVTSTARVTLPLRPRPNGWRSGSSIDVPGLIFLDIRHGMQILEGLVHESAHLHLFIAEAANSLVDSEHTATYPSPLRSDLRPLRSILLAYHALAYISAFYADAIMNDWNQALCEEELAKTRQKMLDAESTLLAARQHLSSAGATLLEQTMEVGRYSGG